jgi:SPP1 family phage portal protein
MDLKTIRNLIETNGRVTSQIISDLIDDHYSKAETMKQLYERYKASDDGVPVFNRRFADRNKINNKLNNDFFSEIIDTKVGYMAGNEIVYESDDEALQEFLDLNNIADLDSEIIKKAAICGYGVRLLYVDTEGQFRMMNVNPWECIFIKDRSIDEVQFALRYYDEEYVDGNYSETRTRVEWYDKEKVTYYIKNSEGEYVLDNTSPVNPQVHFFDFVPMIQYINNEELLGDGEKVLSLIDAYDRKESDLDSELEQLRLAYMKAIGADLTDEVLEEAKKTGAFNIPEGADVAFLEKNLNIQAIDSHLDRLEANILRFAKSVNFSDKEFTSDISGESRKFKLMSLENKCKTMERKFIAANKRLFKVLASGMAKKSMKLDWQNINQKFTRNLPIALEKDAQVLAQLKGIIPDQILYSLASFIEDPEEVMEMMEEQKEKAMNYYQIRDEDDEEANVS